MIQMMPDFSSETLKARRQKSKFCKVLNGKRKQNKIPKLPKILYLAKLIFKIKVKVK